MDMPTISQIEDACDACEGVSWYGKYNGRFHFKGYAIVADSAADLAELISELNSRGLEFPPVNHEDNMGLSRLFAWSTRFFEEPPVRTQHKFRALPS